MPAEWKSTSRALFALHLGQVYVVIVDHDVIALLHLLQHVVELGCRCVDIRLAFVDLRGGTGDVFRGWTAQTSHLHVLRWHRKPSSVQASAPTAALIARSCLNSESLRRVTHNRRHMIVGAQRQRKTDIYRDRGKTRERVRQTDAEADSG